MPLPPRIPDAPTEASVPHAPSAREGPAEPDAAFEHLYPRLRALAQRMLEDERRGHTLQATALVHEAYMRLSDREKAASGETMLYQSAARAIRHVLIDHARKRGAKKRGGKAARAALELESLEDVRNDQDLSAVLSLDDAILRLERVDEQAAEVVRLRFYGGLEFKAIAAALNVSERTAKRAWATARDWLAANIDADER